MARLAMQRELPFDASEAVIDFLPVKEDGTSTTVIAVAVPRGVMDATEQLLEAAGRTAQRVSLRALGASALAGSLGAEPTASTLMVDVTGDSVEFCVVIDGAVRFSRAAEVGPGLSASRLAETVTTETRRTWMSYRIVESAEEVSRALVIGDPEVAEQAARSIGDMLKVPCQVLDYHPLVEDSGHPLGRAWPLAGLLLESVRGTPSIDFAHPRRAPDPGARRRRLTLGGVGAAIVLLVAVSTIASVKLKGLRASASSLARQYQQMIPDRVRYKRDRYRLEHIERWQGVEVDWLEHLGVLTALAPATDQLVLDDFDGVLSFRGVRFDRRAGWSSPREIKITIEGEARDRTTADAFRAKLVEEELYSANTPSPDAPGGRRLPFSFTYTLLTERGRPSGADGAAPDGETDGETP
jgi:hypothetical protein